MLPFLHTDGTDSALQERQTLFIIEHTHTLSKPRAASYLACFASLDEGEFMSLHHLSSGEIISLRPLGDKLMDTPSTALLKTNNLEVMRLVLEAGKSIPEHKVAGEMTLHCLEGKVELKAHQKTQILQAGDIVYLEPMQPYALHATDNASLLMTVLLHDGSASPLDVPAAS